MERVKPFTARDVRSNKYTVIDGKLIITYTKTLDDYVKEVNDRIYQYIMGGSLVFHQKEINDDKSI